MKVRFITTGGTLDKRYNHLNGELIFSASAVDKMLAQGRVTVETEIQHLMLKDSLMMTDEDRHQLAKACESSAESRIVITHGTDTMVDSARAIADRLNHVDSANNKTIVLLGAMIPFQFKESDALFNLGCALSAVQILPPGIYITMNGHVFEYHEVEKNRAAGEFQFVQSNLSEYKAEK
jgi:L-asparaginase